MNKKVKNILNNAEEIFRKVGVVLIPMFLYGVYGYLDLHRNTNVNQTRHSSWNTEYSTNTPYGCAANAIANSDMRSIDKSEALKAMISGKGNDYYEAIMAIVSSDMRSIDKMITIRKISQ